MIKSNWDIDQELGLWYYLIGYPGTGGVLWHKSVDF